jgi:Flp pilus assembly protein TadG
MHASMPKELTVRPASVQRRRAERGATVVEFAIVLPLFVAILFGCIDFGWYYYQKFTLASAVQGGIRSALAVAETDSPDPWTTASAYAATKLAAGGIAPASVTFGPPPGSRYLGVKPTRTMILTATFIFTPLVGLVPLPNKTLTYTSTMTLDSQNAQI